jgi:hypothetical protein
LLDVIATRRELRLRSVSMADLIREHLGYDLAVWPPSSRLTKACVRVDSGDAALVELDVPSTQRRAR